MLTHCIASDLSLSLSPPAFCSHPLGWFQEFKQVISRVITVGEMASIKKMCVCDHHVNVCLAVITVRARVRMCVSITPVWVTTRSCLSFS